MEVDSCFRSWKQERGFTEKHDLAFHKSCRRSRIITTQIPRRCLHVETFTLALMCNIVEHRTLNTPTAALHALKHTYSCERKTKTNGNVGLGVSSSVHQALQLLLAAFLLFTISLLIHSSLRACPLPCPTLRLFLWTCDF